MRLYTFERDGQPRLGAQRNERLVDLAAVEHTRGSELGRLFTDLLTFIQAGDVVHQTAESAFEFVDAHRDTPDLSYPIDEVRILAPLLHPGKILCSGVNYRGHQAENPRAVLPETPGFFAKLNNAIIGPGAPIIHPKVTSQLDYEIEFAVVLGKRLHKASEREAMDAVFGYTILHDVSARDIQFKAPQLNQITLGKNFDTFAPMGPCIVTTDELTDPTNVRLRTFVNGTMLQDSSTSDWLFPLFYLLSFLSHVMTLEPGDIVTTGSPPGVGMFRDPQVFLKPGDLVRLEAEGIGTLENPVVSEG
jgi:2-keto-4-pentenoate hydratase/2-oxohepta-3-ene-1,7-dioic acid hydratase in catechol pathway